MKYQALFPLKKNFFRKSSETILYGALSVNIIACVGGNYEEINRFSPIFKLTRAWYFIIPKPKFR